MTKLEFEALNNLLIQVSQEKKDLEVDYFKCLERDFPRYVPGYEISLPPTRITTLNVEINLLERIIDMFKEIK